MANLSVPVPPMVVWKCPVKDGGKDNPTYGTWKPVPELRALEGFAGSSSVGHSYAKLSLSTGKPFIPQVDVEAGSNILAMGDRIAIGYQTNQKHIDWKFCGYVTSTSLSINDKAESRVWKVSGPEHVWGDGSPTSGAGFIVSGQCRRGSRADDAWIASPSIKTPTDQWFRFDDERCIFNPVGQKNMTRDEVVFSSGTPAVNGNIWEYPGRRFNGVDVASHWDMRKACKAIVNIWGELEFSGIKVNDWENVPMSILDKMMETDVEGVGVYEALRRILGRKYSFYVEPFPTDKSGKPTTISGSSWGPFRLIFFRRTDGPDADLWLNARGTAMAAAKASVRRLEAAGDIASTVNRVVIRGTMVRSIKIIYWGGKTSSLSDANKKVALQQGWYTTDGSLATFVGTGTNKEITPLMAGVAAASRKAWLDKINTTGKDHLANYHIFRRFAWNEGGYLDTSKLTKYGTTTNANIYVPNLDGIANSPDAETQDRWYRRCRRPVDTLYLKDAVADSWIRHPPTLYMAVAKNETDTDFGALKWRMISDAYYRLDPDRMAFTIVAEDISEWKPFDKQETDEQTGTSVWPEDERSFATLLVQGKLRMCLECSIVCDDSLQAKADKEAGGSPLYREVRIAARDNFIVSTAYADGLTPSPSGLTATPFDLRADAKRQAELTRDQAKEERVHSSIVCAADWPLQPIGSHVRNIKGRNISLASSSGNGAQIVAYRIDPVNLHTEYLTESLAISVIKAEEKLLRNKGMLFHAERSKSIGNRG